MRTFLSFANLLTTVGCLDQTKSTPSGTETARDDASRSDTCKVLNEPPDRILDQTESDFSGVDQQWRDEWRKSNEINAIDGQRAIRVLEIACYVDVMCHRIEYPLRVATHDCIRDSLHHSDVREALH
ncbi:MAG: hypothetical protein AAF989_11355 [Planctomycetota bacterium]